MLFKPSTILFVLLGGALLDYLVGYVPRPGNNLSLVSPLIGPCLVLIPIMGVVEWRHRGSFLPILRRTVGSADVRDPGAYYAGGAGGRSKCLLFEHAGQAIGAVCLDARHPGAALPSVLGDGTDGSRAPRNAAPAPAPESATATATAASTATAQGAQAGAAGAGRVRQRGAAAKTKTDTASTGQDAEIRHLTCDLQYRHNGVGTELIAAALDHAFGIAADGSSVGPTGVLRVILCTNPFTRGGEEVWEKTGFKPITVPDAAWRTPDTYGIGKWQGRWMGILKHDWVKRREYLFREGQPQQKETGQEGQEATAAAAAVATTPEAQDAPVQDM